MRLSIFTTATSPNIRGDNYYDSLNCFRDLADEVVIVDGSYQANNPDKKWFDDDTWYFKREIYEWPYDFDWLQISRAYQKGYENCTGDWALFADLDFIFHEKDFEAIRKVMQDNNDKPALSFWKFQFILPDRYNLKSRRVIAINKKLVGDRVKMNGGGDLCQTTLDGKHLTPDDVPESRIAFYNYEKILKTKDQIIDDVGRMERAYFKQFGVRQYGSDGTPEDIYNKWYAAQRGKFEKPQEHISLTDHPKYIQDTIKNLKPENFGYNGFGLIEGRVYA